MSPSAQPDLSFHQRQLLEGSQAAASRVRKTAPRPPGAEGPRPGDLYLLAATADFPVLWLLVEESAGGTFRAVAADTFPLLGPGDRRVTSAPGALRLRLSAEVELAAAALAPELRRGTLPAAEWEAVRAGRSARDESTVADPSVPPELTEWLESVIYPACALAQSAAAPPPREGAVRRWRGAGPVWPALAAGLVGCLLGGGLVSWLDAGRMPGVPAVERPASGSESVSPPRPVPPVRQPIRVNLPFADLSPSETLRGDGEVYRRPAEASELFVVLRLGTEGMPWPRYRVVARRSGEAEPAWQVDDLISMESGSLSLTVPWERLPPGSYRLEVQGRQGEREGPLDRYDLQIGE